MFSGAFIAENFHRVRDMASRDSKSLTYRNVQRLFKHAPEICLIDEDVFLFLAKIKTLGLGTRYDQQKTGLSTQGLNQRMERPAASGAD